MSKRKTFSTTGFTSELADGIKRPFTLVAVVTTELKRKVNMTTTKVTVGNKSTTSYIDEVINYEQQTLSIGLAIVSPADMRDATPAQGMAIATGKADKLKSAIVVLSNRQGYFTNTFVKHILEVEAEKVSKNPAKYVHISATKPTKLTEAMKEYKAYKQEGTKITEAGVAAAK